MKKLPSCYKIDKNNSCSSHSLCTTAMWSHQKVLCELQKLSLRYVVWKLKNIRLNLYSYTIVYFYEGFKFQELSIKEGKLLQL